MKKGSKVYVDGRVTYRSFTDKTGAERQVTEIVCDDFILLSDSKRGESATEASTQEELHVHLHHSTEPVKNDQIKHKPGRALTYHRGNSTASHRQQQQASHIAELRGMADALASN